MSSPDRSSRAWRARAFHLTRDRHFLFKGVAVILGVFTLLGVGLHYGQRAMTRPVRAATAEMDTQMLEEYRRLARSQSATPERLAQWLRASATVLAEYKEEEHPGFDPESLVLGDWEVRQLIEKHVAALEVRRLFASYARARLSTQEAVRGPARAELVQAARRTPVPPFAGEFLGDVLLLEGRKAEATAAYLLEVARPEAVHARRQALVLALEADDTESLRALREEGRALEEMSAYQLARLAQKVGDEALLVRAVCGIQLGRWLQWGPVALALLAGAIWYIILAHSARQERGRWWRYSPGVVAGALSVLLLHWVMIKLDYVSQPGPDLSPTHEMMHWILYVGLPEETCKLALFALFLPSLLREGTGRRAAVLAGCVGLGFALNENIDYFARGGAEAAMTRLVTANFIHISLTGVLGWHLYELCRTRFHSAAGFLTAYLGAAVAHGLYNFSQGPTVARWELDLFAIIIVAVAAKLYFHLLRADGGPPSSGTPVSRTCVFWFGAAVLTGVAMVVNTWLSQELEALAHTLAQGIVLIPVAFIFQREFDEVK